MVPAVGTSVGAFAKGIPMAGIVRVVAKTLSTSPQKTATKKTTTGA